jgi:uncharacterized Zn finger protein
MGWYYGFKPYVPVAKRRAQAASCAAKLAKKRGQPLAPISIQGRAIACSFWGQAWCDNLEAYSDFANRLPRGRTYVRNGSVIDLGIERGKVQALVSGSRVYTVSIGIKTLARPLWKRIKQSCGRSIASLLDLLQGRFDQGIMERLTNRGEGLFPQPHEIEMDCSCPDWADMCKHVAAVLYGIGARLDSAPELLFTLRNVDHLELISHAVAAENLDQTLTADQAGSALAGSNLEELFDIELDRTGPAPHKPRGKRKNAVRRAVAVVTAESQPVQASRRKSGAKLPAKPADEIKVAEIKVALPGRRAKSVAKRKRAAK